MTGLMVWFTFEKLIYTMKKQICKSRIIEHDELDIVALDARVTRSS